MSTGNFDSRVKFGIYCFEPSSYTQEYQICAECDSWNISENEVCDVCGEQLEDCEVRAEIDYMWVDDYINELINNFDNLNCKFHHMRFESGYYESAQIVVDEIYELERMDNEDTRSEFDLCLSETKRQFEVEERKIEKWLKWVCENYPIGHYGVAYQFSNGETGYSKVA